jgi:hypothetical protein
MHQPAHEHQTIQLLAKWGVDLLRLFPKSPRGFTHLVVMIDLFTKWIEAELMTTITTTNIRNFVLWNIFTRFGVPSHIIINAQQKPAL